ARAGALDGLREAVDREVVVLDQHGVAQRVAMVEATAGAHCGPLYRAQTREGLARVENANLAVRGHHVAVRRRRDAGAVAQEVQRGPFAREDGSQRSGNSTEMGATRQRGAVVQIPTDRDLLGELTKGLRRE